MLTEYLAGLPDLATRNQTKMSAGDFTLDRMRELMKALGEPQQRYASLHIAGTNGKGSVAALCAAALKAQGYKVGAFTSPHLHSALDGILVDGYKAKLTDLEPTFEGMHAALEQRRDWTHFEVVTALALLHFARVGVQAAVIEVGLGGRLDATNVIKPTVSVITPIDLDHVSILGSSVAQIAGEKAGIIKDGVPVVMAPQTLEAETVLRAVGVEKNAPLFEVGKDFEFDRGEGDLTGQDVSVKHAGVATKLRIALLGAHQAANAATAFTALTVANERGLAVEARAIIKGFANAHWPGRFEVLQNDPPVVLDAAHSPHAARALAAALDEYFSGRKAVMVLGVSADKDVSGIIDVLRPRIASVIATQSLHPRSMATDVLSEYLNAMGIQAQGETDPARALRGAMRLAGTDELVLVCGSVFLVEEVREAYYGS